MIRTFNLKNCFEWGPGKSTHIFISNKCKVTSVESDEHYLTMIKKDLKLSKAHIIFENDKRYYPYVNGDNVPYDLVLVDGRMREECLNHARLITKSTGIVMLHDAERPQYKQAKRKYKHVFHTDNGNTATLVNDDKRASEIRQLLSTNPV